MVEQEIENTCLSPELETRFRDLWHMAGNTPMIRIDYLFQGTQGSIYAKCEHYNLTGSIKDRMALYILEQAYRDCKIRPGNMIVEATSGNTGISFAAVGKALGHPVKIIMPDWLSRERLDIIRSLGAKIITVSKENGGFSGSIQLAEFLAEQNSNIFLPRQFENHFNPEAHQRTTGKEILAQLRAIGLSPDAFVAGVGTGGTVMGVGACLRSAFPEVKIHPLEPTESPTLSTGHKTGTHRIQGISDEFVPSIIRFNELDAVVQANDGDAILMAQKLASELGLAVGISSGANVIGAIKVRHQMDKDAVVVTVLSDSNKKYLSTDLVGQEPVKPGYISAEVKLCSYKPVHRIFTV